MGRSFFWIRRLLYPPLTFVFTIQIPGRRAVYWWSCDVYIACTASLSLDTRRRHCRHRSSVCLCLSVCVCVCVCVCVYCISRQWHGTRHASVRGASAAAWAPITTRYYLMYIPQQQQQLTTIARLLPSVQTHSSRWSSSVRWSFISEFSADEFPITFLFVCLFFQLVS